jgi:hypothetical protein
VVDLTGGGGWEAAFAGAANAMVAYPLLIGEDGQSHVASKTRWLSNRTFVGEDRSGRIIIGSTREAFFSLEREAAFLLAAPLDLKVALNLDGGPVACQSVRAGGTHRVHIARWEAQEDKGRARLIYAPLGESEMPIVLVAPPKKPPARSGSWWPGAGAGRTGAGPVCRSTGGTYFTFVWSAARPSTTSMSVVFMKTPIGVSE